MAKKQITKKETTKAVGTDTTQSELTPKEKLLYTCKNAGRICEKLFEEWEALDITINSFADLQEKASDLQNSLEEELLYTIGIRAFREFAGKQLLPIK